MAQQAFLPKAKALLVSYDNGVSFFPNPAAPFINPQWRGDFELLGRLLGLALWHQVTLDLPIHPHICEMLLQDRRRTSPNSHEEDSERLAKIDPELYRHKVKWLLSEDISALGFEMPFTDVLIGEELISALSTPQPAAVSSSAPAAASLPSRNSTSQSGVEQAPLSLAPLPQVVSRDKILPGDRRAAEALRLAQFGRVDVELVSGGADIVVTEENKKSFVAALLNWRLHESLREPVDAMLVGLRAAVPSSVLAEAQKMLTPWEVHALLAGSRDIDADDWERNTRTAGGLQPNSQEVRWFWQIVHQWAADGRQDRLQDLLQFATGSRRVPVGGFAQLVGFNGGKHLFTLAKGVHLTSKSLPTSHACICTIDLPPWERFEDAQKKLLAATDAGRGRFDEGLARGDA
eukprot:TRINITY_DN11871_c2_g3_i1.p1 TRINITY_DN11871_c2_g3~~TRINITY_DN11871_c2_g3_i1.p1  ORF type:complete len:469 (-),score=78.29 TRINITY_DN11871_c2_g3_i1:170-1381(-)